MSYLVDTHVAIWSLLEPARLSSSCRLALTDHPWITFVSVVSLWEISVKYGLGKLVLTNITPEGLVSSLLDAGYHLLPLQPDDAASAWRLPRVPHHRDPFDRLLIWQCIRQDLTFLSVDSAVAAYHQYGLRTGCTADA